MDGDEGPPHEFVDNRVDRPAGTPLTYVLPEGADRIEGPAITSRDVRSAAGRFGRFVATPGFRLTTIA